MSDCGGNSRDDDVPLREFAEVFENSVYEKFPWLEKIVEEFEVTETRSVDWRERFFEVFDHCYSAGHKDGWRDAEHSVAEARELEAEQEFDEPICASWYPEVPPTGDNNDVPEGDIPF